MEFDDKKILEILLGLIFVGLLLVSSILVINNSSNKQTPIQNTIVIQDSYNVNNYETSNYQKNLVRYYLEEKDEIYLKYSSYGEHKISELYFNNYKDEFNVYVVNKDYKPGYFKVRFYFCDYYNNCFYETVEKYIPAKEERKFQYLEIQGEKYKFYEWEYDVIAPTLK
jgi:hypothetical protein